MTRKRGKAKRLSQAQMEEMLAKVVDAWELIQSLHDEVYGSCSRSSRVSRQYQSLSGKMQDFKELLEWTLDEVKRARTT